MLCDSVGEVWPMREVNLSLGVQVFIGGQVCTFLTCLADLRYSHLSTQNKINHKSHCSHTLFNQTGTMWPKATVRSGRLSLGHRAHLSGTSEWTVLNTGLSWECAGLAELTFVYRVAMKSSLVMFEKGVFILTMFYKYNI